MGKNIVHFAKSECPTPKQRAIMSGSEEISNGGLNINQQKRTHGHTQGRFFSRKNSNQNMLQNNQLVNPRHDPQSAGAQNTLVNSSLSGGNNRNSFSPNTQQNQIKMAQNQHLKQI